MTKKEVIIHVPKEVYDWYSEQAESHFLEKDKAAEYMVIGLKNWMDIQSRDTDKIDWLWMFGDIMLAIFKYKQSKKMEPFSNIVALVKRFTDPDRGFLDEFNRKEEHIIGHKESLISELNTIDLNFLPQEKQEEVKKLFSKITG